MKHRISPKLKSLFFCLLFAVAFNACEGSYRGLEEKRQLKSRTAKGDIVIGVVTSGEDAGMFLEGIGLAMKDINDDGGIFGRKIRFIIRNDKGRVDKGMEIARELAYNTDVTAVIGHLHSEVAIPVSMIYEAAGILFISPGATDLRLTHQKDSKYIFRNIPSDDVILKHMIEYCKQKDVKRCVVIYDREESTTRQALIFEERAKSSGIDIVTNESYFSWYDDYQSMAAKLIGNKRFDAVFLFGQLPSAGYVIRYMRELGCEVPFFSMPVLDSPRLGSIVGRGAEGTVVPTVFNPNRLSKITRKFVNRFETISHLQPDTMAAQGFDALMLLAHAIRKKGSTVPIVTASVLRFLKDWQGVTGKYGFTVNGDVQGNTFYFKEFKNGSFEYQDLPTPEGQADPFFVIKDICLRIPIKRDVSNLDPGKFLSLESFEIITQIFSGLTEVDPRTSKPVPALAESWTESADGTRYVFKLRKNLKWSNGDDLTAHDVVWSIRRNLSLKVQDPYTETLAVLKNAHAYMQGKLKDVSQVGVRALADDEVEFELSRRVAYFTSMIRLNAFKPLPRAVIEQYKENWTDPSHIIGSGAYTLAFWKKGRKIVLKKNPFYYDAAHVQIPEVHYFVIPEESVGLGMYENDELDILGNTYLNIPEEELERITRDPSLAREYSSWPQAGTYAYCFNTQQSPTDDIGLRKAIASVIDRNLITGLILRTGNEPAYSFVDPLVFGAADPGSPIAIPFNPDAGRKWLRQAGYPDGCNMPRIELLCLKSERHLRLANAVKQLVKHHLNIQIKVIEADWDEYVALIRSDNAPHMFALNWLCDYPDPNNFLKNLSHSDYKILPRQAATKFESLIDRAGETMESDIRKKLYTEAEKILCRQTVSLIPVFYGAGHVLVKPRVNGWYISPFTGQHIKDWLLEK